MQRRKLATLRYNCASRTEAPHNLLHHRFVLVLCFVGRPVRDELLVLKQPPTMYDIVMSRTNARGSISSQPLSIAREGWATHAMESSEEHTAHCSSEPNVQSCCTTSRATSCLAADDSWRAKLLELSARFKWARTDESRSAPSVSTKSKRDAAAAAFIPPTTSPFRCRAAWMLQPTCQISTRRGRKGRGRKGTAILPLRHRGPGRRRKYQCDVHVAGRSSTRISLTAGNSRIVG